MTVLWRWVVLEMVVVSPVSSRRGFYRAWKSMGGRRKAQSGTGSDSSGKAVGPSPPHSRWGCGAGTWKAKGGAGISD